MQTVIKCINLVKAHPKTERLFKAFCEDTDESHVRLLMHTEVRWLSKGACLDRFVEPYDALGEFLRGKEEIIVLQNPDSKTLLYYLAGIFGKLNALNADLQGANKTLHDATIKVFGFVSKLAYIKSEISRREEENSGI